MQRAEQVVTLPRSPLHGQATIVQFPFSVPTGLLELEFIGTQPGFGSVGQ